MKKITYKNQAEPDLKNKISIIKIYKMRRMQGFTLVELMVAVTISIIVLLAASATFITTYKLNQEVKTRISYEQDVRNTADLLRTDARQLGNFGCTWGPSPFVLNWDDFVGPFANDNTQFFSTTPLDNEETYVKVKRTTDIKPLLITYGNEDWLKYIIGDACNPYASDDAASYQTDASYFIVGTTDTNPKPGLYRIHYTTGKYDPVASGAGQWGDPELLVSNVKNMKLTFYYDKHQDSDCPKNEGDADLSYAVEQSDSGVILTKYKQPPILIKVTLTVCPTGDCEKQTTDYVIQAMVPKGEICKYL